MLTEVMRKLVLERMDPDEATGLFLAITHRLPAPENGMVDFVQFQGWLALPEGLFRSRR